MAQDSIDPSLLHECLSAFENLPRTVEEALKGREANEWKQAMDREMESIRQHQTWQVASIPRNRRPIKCRWVFTKKHDKHGHTKKYKARLVAKGYTQKRGIDFVQTFAPVVKFKSIRILAALAAKFGAKMYQDDVPTAFLKGTLKEEVYMEQLPGYSEGNSGEVLRLLKTLYGLKQSPREWYAHINSYLLSKGFVPTKSDPCIYQRKSKRRIIFLGLYVDDIVTFGTCAEEVHEFRTELRNHFNITEGGLLEWYLGLAFNQEHDHITIHQN
jgi:hypothetical protein